MTLSVQNLDVFRGGSKILERVSFSVASGTALILRGPNGIGKTSLLRTIAGLQQIEAGQVDALEEQIVFASHSDGVKDQLTVWENLMFWAEIYGTRLSSDVLEFFDLTDLKDRLAGTLSSGQKRRVGLARLGVTDREIMLLDEPTISLDASSVRLFARFLQDQHLAKGGVAVIATHVDLGLNAPVLETEPFRATPNASASDEAFL